MKRFPALLALLLVASPLLAQSPADEDPYAKARELIADIGRIVAPNGVQESLVVTLGGARQAISVRGVDRENPILLFIHGGPGSVEMPIAWTFQRPWEDFFTVVQWDQRGAGKSYALNDPQALAPTMKPERYREDAIELIEFLRERYGKRKVFLLGHSWGSAVGLMVAAKRPDLLHAYIGVGQLIDVRENERVGMAWAIERLKETNNFAAVREIESLRPYPDEGPFTIENADRWRRWANQFGALAAYRPDANFYFRAPRLSPDYTPADIQGWNDGSLLSVKTLWPYMADLSFSDLRRLEVPVVLFLGRHDYTTPSSIAEKWLERLEAPKKLAIWFEHSAHLPMVEEPGRVLAALVQHVRPLDSSAGTTPVATARQHGSRAQMTRWPAAAAPVSRAGVAGPGVSQPREGCDCGDFVR
ncbi:MAG: alpha/beta hydrolase [Pseudomonadota bacterium]|nr:MAG: alpha/beta hydrolase [Pseudomonadota bacterium]